MGERNVSEEATGTVSRRGTDMKQVKITDEQTGEGCGDLAETCSSRV